MYDPGNHNFSIEEYSKGSTLWTLRRITKKLHKATERSWSATSSTRSIKKRMHAQGYTQSDMEECDTIADEKRNFVASPTDRVFFRDQRTVMQPYQGRGSDVVTTEEHAEYNSGKKGNHTRQSSEPDAEQWSSWSSWTWSLATRSSWSDSPPSQTWRQAP